MAKSINLYIDDSGSRKPDRDVNANPPKYDYFAMGGFMIKEEDEDEAKSRYDEFCARWDITYPLHSVEIRHASDKFKWLYRLASVDKARFYQDLHTSIVSMPIIGMGCVIDRAGYNVRYKEQYADQRWSMCKTAFNIAVERSAKFALANDRKLRVFIESSGKKTDRKIKGYYGDLKANGMPFDKDNSAKYEPFDSVKFSDVLIDFQYKTKSSRLMQLADLLLYPMAVGGYDKSYRAYEALVRDRKFCDAILPADQLAQGGIKYSCFDFREAENSTGHLSIA